MVTGKVYLFKTRKARTAVLRTRIGKRGTIVLC
jgi:hypothetical protein